MTSEAKKAERRARVAALRAGRAVAPAVRHGVPNACDHLLPQTGETEACGSCRGRVTLRVFGCDIHEDGCTIAREVPGRKCCATCPDHSGRAKGADRPHP